MKVTHLLRTGFLAVALLIVPAVGAATATAAEASRTQPAVTASAAHTAAADGEADTPWGPTSDTPWGPNSDTSWGP